MMKYTGYGSGTNTSGFGYKASIGPSAPSTNCTLTTYYPSSGLYKNLSVQYQTNGYVYASTSTGTISYATSSVFAIYGSAIIWNQSSGTIGGGPAQIVGTTLSSSGDTATIYLSDETNNSYYRIQVVKRSSDNYAGICVERLV